MPEIPCQSAEVRSIFDSLRRIIQLLRTDSRSLEQESGVGVAQMFVLQRLAVARAPLSVGELAEATFTHQSSVSGVVARLLEKGLVERRASLADARRSEVSLTPAGRQAAHSKGEIPQERMIAALLRMPEADRRQLALLLETLAGVAGTNDSPPAMFFEDPPTRK